MQKSGMDICTTIHQFLVFNARFSKCITVKPSLDKAYVKCGTLGFLSFEIVSYFDIRISNFGFGCGQKPRQVIHVSTTS